MGSRASSRFDRVAFASILVTLVATTVDLPAEDPPAGRCDVFLEEGRWGREAIRVRGTANLPEGTHLYCSLRYETPDRPSAAALRVTVRSGGFDGRFRPLPALLTPGTWILLCERRGGEGETVEVCRTVLEAGGPEARREAIRWERESLLRQREVFVAAYREAGAAAEAVGDGERDASAWVSIEQSLLDLMRRGRAETATRIARWIHAPLGDAERELEHALDELEPWARERGRALRGEPEEEEIRVLVDPDRERDPGEQPETRDARVPYDRDFRIAWSETEIEEALRRVEIATGMRPRNDSTVLAADRDEGVRLWEGIEHLARETDPASWNPEAWDEAAAPWREAVEVLAGEAAKYADSDLTGGFGQGGIPANLSAAVEGLNDLEAALFDGFAAARGRDDLPRRGNGDPDAARRRIEEALAGIEEAIDAVRRITAERMHVHLGRLREIAEKEGESVREVRDRVSSLNVAALDFRRGEYRIHHGEAGRQILTVGVLLWRQDPEMTRERILDRIDALSGRLAPE